MVTPVGPWTPDDLLVMLDLQEALRDPSPWALHDVDDLADRVVTFATNFPGTKVATRYVLPTPQQARGRWEVFRQRWATLERDNPHCWDLLPGIAEVSDVVVDKTTYSAWAEIELLAHRGARVVVTGAELECCVLATVLAAIDAGYGVVVPLELVSGPNAAAGRGVIQALEHLPEQVEIIGQRASLR